MDPRCNSVEVLYCLTLAGDLGAFLGRGVQGSENLCNGYLGFRRVGKIKEWKRPTCLPQDLSKPN
jgi:hypothetical protein